MDTFAMISQMETAIDELKNNEKKYGEERDQLNARLEELNKLLSPIKTDIEGLELAIEGIKSTSFITKEKPLAAVEVLSPNQNKSLESRPAPAKNLSHSRKPMRVYKFGADNSLIKSYQSICDAAKDMKWTRHKIRDTAIIPKDVQIRKNGFYVTIPVIL